jgi:hypothetical protein
VEIHYNVHILLYIYRKCILIFIFCLISTALNGFFKNFTSIPVPVHKGFTGIQQKLSGAGAALKKLSGAGAESKFLFAVNNIENRTGAVSSFIARAAINFLFICYNKWC